jgi:hypothetical protein
MNVLRSPRSASQRRSWSITAFVGLAITGILVTGCHVRLIGDYDDTIDKGISDIQQRAELYFSKMQSNPNTPYDQSFYDDIRSRLATLRTRAAASFKKEILVQQISELQKQFNDFQKLDQAASRPISASIVTAAESAINVSVESILKLELALKRGAPAPPPPTGAKN